MQQNETNLTNCDREPIHTPGSIQNHGCLIACSIDGGRVVACSDNAEAMLGLAGSPVGKALGACFDGALAHDLFNALAKSAGPGRPGLLRSVAVGGDQRFDISVHQHNGTVIIEFEPESEPYANDPLEIVRALIARTLVLSDRAALNRSLPRFLQTILGYDRVMLYEFAGDGSGKVIGEAKRNHLESFLGQHFPAADIPKQARILYLKNTIRVISDSNGPYSLIVPQVDPSGARLDLSFAHLRSVSPIHLEYLRNMGVGASMSISIIVGGELWGLVACHHYSAKPLPMSLRVAAELYGEFLSLHLTSLYHRERAEATLRTRAALDSLLAEMSFHEDIDTFLNGKLAEFSRLIRCDGVGLLLNGKWTSYGSVPPASAISGLACLSSDQLVSGITAIHALADRFPDAVDYAAEAAGMLAVPLSVIPRDFLFFFRKEKVQTLEWGGDPNKTYVSGPNGDRLTPRQSFAVWKQTVQNQSEPWSSDDRIVAEAMMVGLRDLILRNSEVLSAEREKAEVRQRVLNDELNHRVKNILALIKSLVSQPVDSGENLADYVSGLKGRIVALSHAHDQVVRSDGGGSLRQLLEAELSPYPLHRVNLVGVDVGLDARAYSVMALVLHELATNAAKYGALSGDVGEVTVTWERDRLGTCSLTWLESGGPSVRQPTRQGFGSVLMHRSIPFDLQGTSAIIFHSTGVEARITIPPKFTSQLVNPSKDQPHAPATAAPRVDLQSSTILLLEDQFVIALDAEDMLKDIGAGTVVTVSNAQEALDSIRQQPPHVAVLDVNLGTGTSLEVAEELMRRGVPFVFATGYGDTAMIADHMRSVPIVRKPYSGDSLKAAIEQVLNKTE